MARSILKYKISTFISNLPLCIASLLAILLVCAWFTVSDHCSNFVTTKYDAQALNTTKETSDFGFYGDRETSDTTFYDDHETSYVVGEPMVDWDTKRMEWLRHHRDFMLEKENRVLVVTGTQPSPCENPKGDHLLLRLFKNKVDYCRRQGYKIFYNNALLDPEMKSSWGKHPIVRAAMVAHPDVEWIFWVDSDAVFTDMEFKIPLDKYKDHNFVIMGWPDLLLENKTWLAINAGVFLIRNCQWSMDFLDVWASYGPRNPNHTKWGEFFRSYFVDRGSSFASDQTVLSYLLYEERKKWGDKIYLENDYQLSGYWLVHVKTYENITRGYLEMENRIPVLRRRHAEAVSASYGALREQYVVEGVQKRGGQRRPYIIHFTGCSLCKGEHNPMYSGDSCLVGLERTLNGADNQVLRSYGFIHSDLGNDDHVDPVPFDFPRDEI